mgnify:CR=1 FL=1
MVREEENTTERKSRTCRSYAVVCWKKKKNKRTGKDKRCEKKQKKQRVERTEQKKTIRQQKVEDK